MVIEINGLQSFQTEVVLIRKSHTLPNKRDLNNAYHDIYFVFLLFKPLNHFCAIISEA